MAVLSLVSPYGGHIRTSQDSIPYDEAAREVVRKVYGHTAEARDVLATHVRPGVTRYSTEAWRASATTPDIKFKVGTVLFEITE